MSKNKRTGQGSICLRCRRSEADLAANPEGYCSWLAEGRLPEGVKSVPVKNRYSTLSIVVYCPEFEKQAAR